MDQGSLDRVEEVLHWAERALPKLRKLCPNHPRTKHARILEVLAREAVNTIGARRCIVLTALFMHLEPFLRQLFFTEPTRQYSSIELQDYIQECYVSVINMLENYYDPYRGPFVSICTQVCKQVAWSMARNHRDRDDAEIPLHDVPVETTHSSAFLAYTLREFADWHARSNRWPLVPEVARILAEDIENGNYPQASHVADALGVSSQRARTAMDRTYAGYRNYLATYYGVTTLEGLEKPHQ